MRRRLLHIGVLGPRPASFVLLPPSMLLALLLLPSMLSLLLALLLLPAALVLAIPVPVAPAAPPPAAPAFASFPVLALVLLTRLTAGLRLLGDRRLHVTGRLVALAALLLRTIAP